VQAIHNELKEVRAIHDSPASQPVYHLETLRGAPDERRNAMSEPKPKLPPLDPQPRDPYQDPFGPEPDEPDPDVIDPMEDPLPA
jgi:hypothetical protein